MADYPLIEFSLAIGTWDVQDLGYPDTGFEGGLSIPVGVGREILAEPDKSLVRLADGSLVSVPEWVGTVWLGEGRFTTDIVAIGDRYLIGRGVLDRLEICFEFGRAVRLRFREGY